VTCIVGLVDKGGSVWMGADSAGVDGALNLSVRTDGKLFQNGPFLIGFTSSFRMGQILQHALKPPEPNGGELHRFMVTSFVDAVRACLKSGGFARKECEVETGGAFLVGVGGRLFEIASDYQVGENADPFNAVGSGAAVALGALHATRSLPWSPAVRLRRALEAAERFNAGVRGPFIIRRLRP
jgi:hypothetical protein